MSKTEFTAEEFEALDAEQIWPRFLLFPTVAAVGYVGFVSGLGGDGLVVKLAWSLFLGVCWACVAGSFHESVHQTMGRWRTANIWFGRVVGTLLGIPYSAYRETHIRHHAYMNTPDDYELWPYCHPRASIAFRRAFVVFNVLGGVVVEPFIHGRIYFKKSSPLKAEARKTIRQEYMGMAAFWGILASAVMALQFSGTIDCRRFDPLWLLPLPIAAAINAIRKFVEHLGMPSTEPFLGTRTIIGNNPITRICSYFNFELDVHGPHHRYPKTPHFELESKLTEYRRKYPEVVVPVFPTYLSAVRDMLPCLWRNPGVGENAARDLLQRDKNRSDVQTDSNLTAIVGHRAKTLLPPGIENFTSEVSGQDGDAEAAQAA